LSEDFVNTSLCCFLKEDLQKKDALMVRVFGTFSEASGVSPDRDIDVMGLQLAHHLGFGQKVYAIFKNGVVYGYTAGSTLTGQDVTDPKILR
jgi:hypothetical protein